LEYSSFKLFGGLFGRIEINVFLRIKLCHFKIISSNFLGYYIIVVSGLDGNKNLNFLGSVDYIMDDSLGA